LLIEREGAGAGSENQKKSKEGKGKIEMRGVGGGGQSLSPFLKKRKRPRSASQTRGPAKEEGEEAANSGTGANEEKLWAGLLGNIKAGRHPQVVVEEVSTRGPRNGWRLTNHDALGEKKITCSVKRRGESER